MKKAIDIVMYALWLLSFVLVILYIWCDSILLTKFIATDIVLLFVVYVVGEWYKAAVKKRKKQLKEKENSLFR